MYQSYLKPQLVLFIRVFLSFEMPLYSSVKVNMALPFILLFIIILTAPAGTNTGATTFSHTYGLIHILYWLMKQGLKTIESTLLSTFTK